MPLVDRVSRRKLLRCSSILQILAFIPFIFPHATFVVARFNVLLFSIGARIGQQSLFQLRFQHALARLGRTVARFRRDWNRVRPRHPRT